jgi:hypothetical protein
VRDLASFMLDRIRVEDPGIYGMSRPSDPIAMRDVLETSGTRLVRIRRWLGRPKLSCTISTTRSGPGSRCGSEARACTRTTPARLSGRSPPSATRQTVADTLAWDADRDGRNLRAGSLLRTRPNSWPPTGCDRFSGIMTGEQRRSMMTPRSVFSPGPLHVDETDSGGGSTLDGRFFVVERQLDGADSREGCRPSWLGSRTRPTFAGG